MIAGNNFLIWWDPAHNRVVQPLDGCDRLLIGRSLDCDIVLADLGVSRRHALLSRDGDIWFVEDAGSRAGTFVRRAGRGKSLAGRIALRDGDEIFVGWHSLTFGCAMNWREPATDEPVADGPPQYDMTSAQAKVLLALCAPAFDGRGFASNIEIAQQLTCSVTTVRSHLKQLYRELRIPADLPGTQRRAALVARALVSNCVTQYDVKATSADDEPASGDTKSH